MRDLIIVAKFTIKDMIKRKSFIISNVIILLIIIILFNIPNIIKIFKGDDADAMAGDRLLIVDADNIFEGNLESLKNMNLNYDIQIDEKLVKNVETRDSDNNSGITEVDNSKEDKIFEKIKEKIQNDEIDKAILIEDKEGIINIQ